jgi:hypothetical protein
LDLIEPGGNGGSSREIRSPEHDALARRGSLAHC